MDTSSSAERSALSRARAIDIGRTLRRQGHEALLCGGSVRDRLLQRTPKDHDVATSAKPEEVAALFPRSVMVGAQFGVVVVPHAHGDVEVASFRADGLYVDGRRPEGVVYSDPPTDAQRRDFTVNALFEDPDTGEIHDYVGGRADLESRLLRAIGDPEARFREDHLRLLRGVRFAVQLNFAIEPTTMAAIRHLAPLVSTVSAERIRAELVPLLRTGRGKGLRLLRDSGLLPIVLPEIEAMRGVPHMPDWHPEGDVFTHTALVLDGVDLEALAREDGIEDEEAHTDLVLAALLHDICKPETFSRGEDGRISFHGHESAGRRRTEELLTRLRFPKRQTERVADLVGQHMRFAQVEQMRQSKLRQFLGQPDIALHLRLHEADCGASHGKMDLLAFCRDKLAAFGAEPVLPPPLLSGRDLLALGYVPGPALGQMLRWVREEQLEGRLADAVSAAREVQLRFPLAGEAPE
jgi:poly(A) polymerase